MIENEEQRLAFLACDGPENTIGMDLVCIKGKVSVNGQVHYFHEACHGTGLQYPELSQECKYALYAWHDSHCKVCHQGRTSDVTVAKVMELLLVLTAKSGNSVSAALDDEIPGMYVCELTDSGTYLYSGSTLLATLVTAALDIGTKVSPLVP